MSTFVINNLEEFEKKLDSLISTILISSDLKAKNFKDAEYKLSLMEEVGVLKGKVIRAHEFWLENFDEATDKLERKRLKND